MDQPIPADLGICVSRYECRLRTRREPVVYNEQSSFAIIEEVRERDEWGNPGRLVRRKLLSVEGAFGPTWADHHRSKHSGWRLELGPRSGQLSWAGTSASAQA